VEFYRESAAEFPIANVLIANNIFSIIGDSTVTGIQKAAVNIASLYGVTDIEVAGNIAYKTGTTVDSAFIIVETRAAAGSEKKETIVVSSNEAHNFTYGVAISCRNAIGLGSVLIKNNAFHDLIAANSLDPVGVAATVTAGAVDNLEVSNNTIKTAKYGVFLSGSITIFYNKGNTFVGITTAEIDFSGATITTLSGDFDNLAYTPTVTGITALGNGVINGRYTRRGKQITLRFILTVGSTTTFSGVGLAVSLPGSAAAISSISFIGAWTIFDSSASLFYVGSALLQGTATTFTMCVNGAVFVTNTSPITLATGDVISAEIVYNEV
jgi:hypothetical protein